MKNKILKSTLLIAILGIGLWSCNKDHNSPNNLNKTQSTSLMVSTAGSIHNSALASYYSSHEFNDGTTYDDKKSFAINYLNNFYPGSLSTFFDVPAINNMYSTINSTIFDVNDAVNFVVDLNNDGLMSVNYSQYFIQSMDVLNSSSDPSDFKDSLDALIQDVANNQNLATNERGNITAYMNLVQNSTDFWEENEDIIDGAYGDSWKNTVAKDAVGACVTFTGPAFAWASLFGPWASVAVLAVGAIVTSAC